MKQISLINAPRELALRTKDLCRMKQFYREMLGFELLGEFPSAVLLKKSKAGPEQTQFLGLFQRSCHVASQLPTLPSRLIIAVPHFDVEQARLERAGLRVEITSSKSFQPRSLIVCDPESNQIQLICCETEVGANAHFP